MRVATGHLKPISRNFILSLSICLFLLPLSRGSNLYSQERENSELKMAIGLINDGMYDLASGQLKNIIEAYPNSSQGIEARFYLGVVQSKLKNYDEARGTFQSFALTYPENTRAPEAWMRVGDCYAALGNNREAASAYERVRVFHPKSSIAPEALLKAGGIYSASGDMESALRSFRTIVQEYASSDAAVEARLSLAIMYADQGDPERADHEVRGVLRADAAPGVKARALYVLGKLQALSGLGDTAEVTLRSVIKNYPSTPSAPMAAFLIGDLKSAARDYPGAIEQYRVAASHQSAADTLQAAALFAISRCYMLEGNNGSARKSFGDFLRKYPGHRLTAQATLLCAESALDDGDAADAMSVLRPLIRNHEASQGVDIALCAARASRTLSRFREAAGYYSDAVREAPDDPRTPGIILDCAKLYAQDLADPQAAADLCGEFFRKYPGSGSVVTALWNRAAYLEDAGDFAGALRTYREIQTLFPANDRFDSIQSRITIIGHHRSMDNGTATRRLAGVMGLMIDDPASSRLPLELGKIDLEDLKEYSASAAQFAAAVKRGASGDDLAAALLGRATALRLESESDTASIAPAIAAYETFLGQFPDSRDAVNAADELTLLRLRKTPSAGIPPLVDAYIKVHPDSKIADDISYRAGIAALSTGDTSTAAGEFSAVTRMAHASPVFVSAAVLQRGYIFAARNVSDSAEAMWKQGAAVAPPAPAVVQSIKRLAESYGRNGNSASAIASWERLSTDFYYTAAAQAAHTLLPELYATAGEFDKAILLLKQESGTGGPDPATSFRLAEIYNRKGETGTARSFYRKYLLAESRGIHAAESYTALGRIARAEGKTELAAALFRKASVTGGSTTGEIADLLFQTEQYEEASRQYSLLAASVSASAPVRFYHLRSVIATLRAGHPVEGEKLFADFSKLYKASDTEKSQVAFEHGALLYRQQNYAEARKYFARVTDDFMDTPSGPWAKFYLGKIDEVTSHAPEAAKIYESILEKYPSSDVAPRVLLSLGNMHFNAERFDEAIRYYQQILKKPGGTEEILPYAMNNLIQAYESMKVYDAAITTARDFITRWPNDESVLDKKITIGTLYTKLGYYDQAISYFQALIGEAGSAMEGELRYDIGEAYFDKGDYQQAILEFLKVPYLTQTEGKVNWTATSLYMAGQSYEKLSKFEEAIGMYRQIVDRAGIDATFKAGARKEIDRVQSLMNNHGK
jgi:TolA-binding protein